MSFKRVRMMAPLGKLTCLAAPLRKLCFQQPSAGFRYREESRPSGQEYDQFPARQSSGTKSDSFRARRLTRRELIILLTAGAGFFAVAKASAGLLTAQFPKGAGNAPKLSPGPPHPG